MKSIKKFTDKKANTIRVQDQVQLSLKNQGEPVRVVIDNMTLGNTGILLSNKLDGKVYEWPLENVSMIVFSGDTYTRTTPVNNLEVHDADEEDIDTRVIMLVKELNQVQRKLSDTCIKITNIWDAESNGIPVDYASDQYQALQADQYALSHQISSLQKKLSDTYNGGY